MIFLSSFFKSIIFNLSFICYKSEVYSGLGYYGLGYSGLGYYGLTPILFYFFLKAYL